MAQTPLYRKVQESLLDRINRMQIGEMLPPEPELEHEFSVSRATVRRAIENLVQSGVLEKRQGRGTTIRDHPEAQDVGRVYSWKAEMARRGVESSSRLLSIGRDKPSRRIAQELRLSADELVVVVSRLQLVKGAPIALIVNTLRERYVPDLVERGLPAESLYEELTGRYGLSLAGGEETIGAREATAIEASLLEVPEGSALLNVRRVTSLRGNVPFEVVDMAARGDKYKYHATLAGALRKRG